MIASSVKRCLRSVAASIAIAPSMAAGFKASFFRGKWQMIPTHFRYFSTSDSLHPWLHLPMDACVRDARFDQTFKILLGEEGAERRAISFLNAVLRLEADGDRIKHIQFLDGSRNSVDNRAIHFDVKIQGLCSTHAGHTFLVEMQKFRVPSHMNRWIFYAARELSEIGKRLHNAPTSRDKDVNRKNFYTGMAPVKVIVIADFDSLNSKWNSKIPPTLLLTGTYVKGNPMMWHHHCCHGHFWFFHVSPQLFLRRGIL